MLIQLDMSERVEKLEETVSNVEEGYEVLLKAFTEREEALKARQEELGDVADPETTAVVEEGASKDQRAKRKFTVEEDDEDEDEDEAAKRAKV